jgi:manganese oxidase
MLLGRCAVADDAFRSDRWTQGPNEISAVGRFSHGAAQMRVRLKAMSGESTQEPPTPNGAEPHAISRRRLLTAGIGGAGLVGAAAMSASLDASRRAFAEEPQLPHSHAHHLMPMVVGEVDHAKNGFNPTEILSDFDPGKVGKLPNGQTLHEYTFIAQNTVVEIVPGLKFAAWTYNGRIPGPTIRVRQGDRVRIKFLNAGDHEHSIHFHGIHPGNMDGVFDAASGAVQPGEKFTYES